MSKAKGQGHIATGRIISKPDAVVEVKSMPIDPRVREAISRALKQGHHASAPPVTIKSCR